MKTIYRLIFFFLPVKNPICRTTASFKVGSMAFYTKKISRNGWCLGESTSISYENVNGIYKQRSDGSFIILQEDTGNSFQEFFFTTNAKLRQIAFPQIMHA